MLLLRQHLRFCTSKASKLRTCTMQKDWSKVPSGLVDLAATSHGGLGLMASNAHYGRPQNLLGAGRGVNMGDGWETARNPNRPPEFKVHANLLRLY